MGPLERWTLRGSGELSFELDVRGALAARGVRRRSQGHRQGRRDGGLRAALPRQRDGRRHAPEERARPARALVGQPGLGQDRAHARRRRLVRGRHRRGPADRPPDQGRQPRRRGVLGGDARPRTHAHRRGAAPEHDHRRGRAPAARRSRAVAGRATTTTRSAASARSWPARRSSSAPCAWTSRSSAGTSRAAARSAATTSCAARDQGGHLRLRRGHHDAADRRLHARPRRARDPGRGPRHGDAPRRRARERAAAVDARARPAQRARLHRRARGDPRRGDRQARRPRRLRSPPDARAGAERRRCWTTTGACATSTASGSRC